MTLRMDLRFKLHLQLLVAANILGVEEDLRDGGFARPLLQPRPHPGGEPVHAHLHVLEVLILQTLLGGQTVGTPGDGVDCDPAQLAHDQSQLSIHRRVFRFTSHSEANQRRILGQEFHQSQFTV